jgi:RimJ/RimL family protein N-acetyltransferase
LEIRTAVETDLDAVLALMAEKSVNTATPERFTELLANGHYKYAHTWVALDAGEVVGAAVWWSFPAGTAPMSLDGLYAAPSVTQPSPMWTELIRAARAVAPECDYHIFLPGGWRDDSPVLSSLEPRLAAARAAGLGTTLERLRFEWLSSMPVPARSSRLTFRPEPDDEAFVNIFKRVAEGSLDYTTHQEIARDGLDAYARSDLELYQQMPGERTWWKFAYDAAGDLVGFAMPSRNNGGPVVGFLGVVPEHRGHGYGEDLLAEITADLADLGAERITADTDLDNTPMAAAFRRLGYTNFAVRLVLS